MNRNVSGDGLIVNGSKIGSHTLEFYGAYMRMQDTGGLFVDASSKKLDYKTELLQVSVAGVVGGSSLMASGISVGGDRLFSFTVNNEKMFHILSKCEYYEDFITIHDYKDYTGVLMKKTGLSRGDEPASSYTIVKHGQKHTFAKLDFANGYLTIDSGVGTIEKIQLSHIRQIQNDVMTGSDSTGSIRTSVGTYEIIQTSTVRRLLDQVKSDLAVLHRIGDVEDQVVLKGMDGDLIAYIKESQLKIYEASTLDLRYEFDVRSLNLYLGSRYLLLQHGGDVICCSNESARLLCAKTGIRPIALHALEDARLVSHGGQWSFDELLVWQDVHSWYMYARQDGRMVRQPDHAELRRSSEDPRLVVFGDGLVYSETPADFLETIDTPRTVKTKEGFPVFLERLDVSTMRVAIPGKVLWEDRLQVFYGADTRQVEGGVLVAIRPLELRIPLALYKSHYTQSLLEAKTPSIPDVPITMLLTSRARNLSDMLIYEFFGQWQILMDYMSSSVDGEEFSEEEIKNHGLFMYHAIYQQRKRMEEISSKFPRFMSTLADEVGIGRDGDRIHRMQQRQMFQLSAQLKSQFTEIENLLSQVTYVHFHNDEYQRRIDKAYKDSGMKRVGGAIVVGVGIGVLTGGFGLVLPAMGAISEWTTSKQRKELSDIQAEKEYKKNAFLFKKAIDLVRHMDAFTINHHVDVLNQFTFETLQLEAKEIMKLELGHGRRGKLLEQSVHLYSKNTLPVDFDQGLVPQRVVTSILDKPSKKDEGIASLFLD